MKKTLLKFTTISVLFLTFCIAFSSCKKEIYDPGRKIKKIYSDVQKTLDQEWTWEKNNLIKIDYFNPNNGQIDYSEYFFYKNSKLVKIQDDEGHIQISYTNSRYDKIEQYSNDGSLLATWDFSYKSNKIERIVFTYEKDYMSKKMTENGFLSALIPKEFLPAVEKSGNAKNKKTVSYTYKYDGDNVKEIKVEYEDTKVSITITFKSYDTMQNPLYRKIVLPRDTYGSDFLITSKNNPLEVEIRMPTDVYEFIQQINYSYIYDGNFPIEMVMKVTMSGMINRSFRTYYEYE